MCSCVHVKCISNSDFVIRTSYFKNILMKKILLVLFIVAPLITHAQLWYVGGKAGVSFSNYKTQTPRKDASNIGFSFGATAFKQINTNYGLNIELHYIQKGFNHKICNEITEQLQTNYLEIPVMIDYT